MYKFIGLRNVLIGGINNLIPKSKEELEPEFPLSRGILKNKWRGWKELSKSIQLDRATERSYSLY